MICVICKPLTLDLINQPVEASQALYPHRMEGWPALFLACERQHESVVKALLECHLMTKDVINQLDVSILPLSQILCDATWNGHETIFRLIIEHQRIQPDLVDIKENGSLLLEEFGSVQLILLNQKYSFPKSFLFQ